MGQENRTIQFEAKEWNAGGAINFYGPRKPRSPCEKLPYESFSNPEVELSPEQGR